MTARTPKDLENALATLQRAHERSRPGKDTEISNASAEVRAIERDLKQAGIIPRTAKEVLDAALDAAFPDAPGTEVVAYQGNHYKRTFFAVRKSARGKILEWGRVWEGVPG